MEKKLLAFLLLTLFIAPSGANGDMTLKIVAEVRKTNSLGYNTLHSYEEINGYMVQPTALITGGWIISVYDHKSNPLNPSLQTSIDSSILSSADSLDGGGPMAGDGINFFFQGINTTGEYNYYLYIANNITNPSIVAEVDLGNTMYETFFYNNKTIYAINNGNKYTNEPSTITRIDISDLDNVMIDDSAVPDGNTGHDIDILGMKDNLLILQYTGYSTYIINAVDPVSLESAHMFSTTSFMYDGFIFDDYYISENFKVVNMTNLASMQIVEVDQLIANIQYYGIIGDYAYLANNSAIVIFDSNFMEIFTLGGLIDSYRSLSSYDPNIDGYFIYIGSGEKVLILEWSDRVVEDTSETLSSNTDNQTSTDETSSSTSDTEQNSLINTSDTPAFLFVTIIIPPLLIFTRKLKQIDD